MKVNFISPFFIVKSKLKTKLIVTAELHTIFPLAVSLDDRQQHERKEMEAKELHKYRHNIGLDTLLLCHSHFFPVCSSFSVYFLSWHHTLDPNNLKTLSGPGKRGWKCGI